MRSVSEPVHIVVNKHTPYVVPVFERLGKVSALETRQITKESVRDADILIVRSETVVDKNLLDGSKVKFVGTVTIGTDHVDEQYLADNGITFVSAPGSNSNSVSEYIIAALLELARRYNFSLKGKTIGIVGVGNVGSKVWKKAEALGMNVLLNDPSLQRTGSPYPFHTLDELMDADFITLHVPFTNHGEDATHHLFDEARIRKMKKGSFLINSSRGGVVESAALKKNLTEGHLAGVVLDVWEGEPRIHTDLLECVSLGTPHIAGYSLDGKVNALRMNYEAVCTFLAKPQEEIESLMEEPVLSDIQVPLVQKTPEELLRDIVRNCYDISEDDANLRAILHEPVEERGKYFSRLRAGYRIRREFIHSTVSLLPEQNNLAKTLNALGFKTKS